MSLPGFRSKVLFVAMYIIIDPENLTFVCECASFTFGFEGWA